MIYLRVWVINYWDGNALSKPRWFDLQLQSCHEITIQYLSSKKSYCQHDFYKVSLNIFMVCILVFWADWVPNQLLYNVSPAIPTLPVTTPKKRESPPAWHLSSSIHIIQLSNWYSHTCMFYQLTSPRRLRSQIFDFLQDPFSLPFGNPVQTGKHLVPSEQIVYAHIILCRNCNQFFHGRLPGPA